MCSFIEIVFVYTVCLYIFLHVIDVYHSKIIDVDASIEAALLHFEKKREDKKAKKASKN